jgi:hypothetical protein
MGIKIFKNTIPQGLKRVAGGVDTAVKEAIARGLVAIQNQVLDYTPVVTGYLKQSIGNKISKEGIYETKRERKGWVGKMGTAVIYAKRVEFGSGRNRLYFTRGFNQSKSLAYKLLTNRLSEYIKKGR